MFHMWNYKTISTHNRKATKKEEKCSYFIWRMKFAKTLIPASAVNINAGLSCVYKKKCIDFDLFWKKGECWHGNSR
jgi:hypothetical protein